MLVLRDARPSDADGVATVHVRSWQAAYRGLLPDAVLDGLRPEDRRDRYTFGVADPDAPATVVAVGDDRILGFVTVGPGVGADGGPAGEVLALYADPGAWGTGVGRELLAEGRRRLSVRWGSAVLWILAGNVRAERFYRADGWVVDGTARTAEVWGVPVDERRLVRPLP